MAPASLSPISVDSPSLLGAPPMASAKDAERFWKFVLRASDVECWLWSGGRKQTRDGSPSYGQFSMYTGGKFKCVSAHRFSYELHSGPVPDGLSVCHTCDIPQCVNPHHLFVGSPADNGADAAAKNRYRKRIFTADEIAEIKARYAAGETKASIAKTFGVGPQALGDYAKGYRSRRKKAPAQLIRREKDGAYRRLLATMPEGVSLVETVTRDLAALTDASRISYAELAERATVSRQQIDQVFDAGVTTFRMAAAVAKALGYRVRVEFDRVEDDATLVGLS